MLPQLNTFYDLIKKLEYDLERHANDNNIYVLLDCLLTLNAIPEWIIKSKETNSGLKKFAEGKLDAMKFLDFDEDRLDTDINHKLRLVRLICNHAKHKKEKGIPIIERIYGGTLPMTLPAKLFNVITIGKTQLDAEVLIQDLKEFWGHEIQKNAASSS